MELEGILWQQADKGEGGFLPIVTEAFKVTQGNLSEIWTQFCPTSNSFLYISPVLVIRFMLKLLLWSSSEDS